MKSIRLTTLFALLLIVLGALTPSGGKDYTKKDREQFITGYQDTLSISGISPTLDQCIYHGFAIFTGTLIEIEDPNDPENPDVFHDSRYIVQVNDVWFGEVVGKTVEFKRVTYYTEGLFDGHIGNSYVFICRTHLDWDGMYLGENGVNTIFPIQPSTGKLYPICLDNGFDELDGKNPEYLQWKVRQMQKDVLKNGFDFSELKGHWNERLGSIFQPYQTAYETGKPVEFIPYVIRKLIEGPLSAYEEEPYYDALLTRVKKAYNSRKSRWGMTEGKLYSILEKMLPKLAEKAERECG